MAWTVPATAVAGSILAAAFWNQQVRDNLSLVKTSISNDGLTWSGAVNGTTGTFSGAVTLAATQRLYLDGGGDTYFAESSANRVDLTVGAIVVIRSEPTYVYVPVDFMVGATKRLYLDGGGDTYVTESSANVLGFYVGGVRRFGIEAATGAFIEAAQKFYLDGGGNTYIQEAAADTVVCFAGGVEALRWTGTGNVGVGGINPGVKFHVAESTNGNWTTQIQHTSASTPYGIIISYTAAAPNAAGTSYFIFAQDNAATRFAVDSNGGIRNFSAFNTNLSDLGAKDITGPAPSQRGKIRQITMYRGRYKDSTSGHDDLMWGAQDILAIEPEWVDVWQEEEIDAVTGAIVKPRLLGTRDHIIFMANVAVTAEHADMLDDHETRIAALEAAA